MNVSNRTLINSQYTLNRAALDGVFGILSVPCWAFRWPFRYVHDGQEGLVLELGKPQEKIVTPGNIHFVNPLTSRMKIIHITETLIEIHKRQYTLQDGNLEMGVIICYKVSSAKKFSSYNEGIESTIRYRMALGLEYALADESILDAQSLDVINFSPPLNLNDIGIQIIWLEVKYKTFV